MAARRLLLQPYGSAVRIRKLYSVTMPLKRKARAVNPIFMSNRMVALPKPRYMSSTAHSHSQTPVLVGRCSCGDVGWEGDGPSAINFTCHCSICRKSSGLASLSAVGFKEDQVNFINLEGMEKKISSGSANARFYCKSCGDYVAEDATSPLGVIALPTALSQHVPVCYRPNHHIFYADRVADGEATASKDGLPKWMTLPGGDLVEPSCNNSSIGDATGSCTSKHGAPSDAEVSPTRTSSPSSAFSRGVSSDGQSPVNGQYRKDVLPVSPTRAPDPKRYCFPTTDPPANHMTYIAPETVQERVSQKYFPSPGAYVAPARSRRDVVIIGGGHNGLVSAAYLAKQGLDVCVLERRDIVGGGAVTEEIIPGFKFSRGAYLAGLLRPHIIEQLELAKYGFKYLTRDPSSFTPSHVSGPLRGKFLLLGQDEAANHASISQFSRKDADAFPLYEDFLGKIRDIITPLLDAPLPQNPAHAGLKENLETLRTMKKLVSVGAKNREVLVPFYELLTGPASHLLDRWFESEMLKTTLATDAVIGAMVGPKQAGSAYVLLHHVMGEAAGQKGVWAYVEGGMGSVSQCLAQAAREAGAEIVTNATVDQILYETTDQKNGGARSAVAHSNGRDGSAPASRVRGVKMADGSELHANTVLSNATPYHTFLELLPGLSRDSGNLEEVSPLPADFQHHIRFADYSCGSLKINVAVNALPNFECKPNPEPSVPGGVVPPQPQHFTTTHFEQRMEELENAYREASMGMPATRPVIEMTVPSALDSTLAPPGSHVVQLFVQFAPYELDPKFGNWADEGFKQAFADRCFAIVDEYCPGFSASVIGRDILSPLDLERLFGMHKGNIFHGSLAIHQLGYARPAFGYSSHRSPMEGLYMCGAGTHPGGGVMGTPGHNCSKIVLSDLGRR